jgi:hypothetical protein
MSRKTISWTTVADNLKGIYQPTTKGNFWDDGKGFMVRAVLHALAMIASTPAMTQLGETNNDLYHDLQHAIRNGNLPLYLSEYGYDGRSAVVVDTDGAVGSDWDGDSDWLGITIAEISLSPAMRRYAGLADYYFWWAWRLHSRWAEQGGQSTWVAGATCARLALSCIAGIAEVIAHEWVHLQGYWPGHCRGMPPADALDIAGWAEGFAAGAYVVEAFTWLGAVAAFGAVEEEGCRCRHDVVSYGSLALIMATYALPFPVVAVSANPSDAADGNVGALLDGDAEARSWDEWWATANFINIYPVGSTRTMLLGTQYFAGKGSYEWYETIWGFSAVLESDSCATGTFNLIWTWDLAGSSPVHLNWQVPASCTDDAKTSARRATY